ncbi:MotA/TolQ/ExbB proton channel family protein [Vibrio algicola]|uniref:Flagellar motor protein MotA n=1 Tax=Vibrio algicola TaxID=2662262 RepID=A0A5Q0TGW7_9VIBR|nr:MotA/TolQ/ExbB proton channel family protein [Vibrio algicola]
MCQSIKKNAVIASLILTASMIFSVGVNANTVNANNANANDLSSLSAKAKAEQIVENKHNHQRVVLSAEQRAKLQSQRDQLAKQLAQIEKQNAQLSETFATNEKILAEKSKTLQLATGSLGELFGVVRLAAKEVQSNYQDSLLGAQGQRFEAQLDKVISTDALPSLPLLTDLWQAMSYKIRTSSELSSVSISYVEGDGKTSTMPAIRLGDIGLVSSKGYLNWDFTRQQASNYLALPSDAPNLESLTANLKEGNKAVLLDPTRGVLLAQFANQPTLMQRIEQAGVVGKIILALLAIGLIIALIRGVKLMQTQQQISKQLKHPQTPTDNPLGRILNVYQKEKKQSVESLELRLLETVLDEQQGLERGLSMLKLFAALAPMLGLLGTVTGMIETFQVITEFGNSDPKVMAGGISMALITTVLGLVAAMPLLLAHNILSNRAESIRNTLEKQGVSLVAERAEKESDTRNENNPVPVGG